MRLRPREQKSDKIPENRNGGRRRSSPSGETSGRRLQFHRTRRNLSTRERASGRLGGGRGGGTTVKPLTSVLSTSRDAFCAQWTGARARASWETKRRINVPSLGLPGWAPGHNNNGGSSCKYFSFSSPMKLGSSNIKVALWRSMNAKCRLLCLKRNFVVMFCTVGLLCQRTTVHVVYVCHLTYIYTGLRQIYRYIVHVCMHACMHTCQKLTSKFNYNNTLTIKTHTHTQTIMYAYVNSRPQDILQKSTK